MLIEFGWATILVSKLPVHYASHSNVRNIKTNTDVYLLKVHRDHMNVQLCYLPDN